MTPRSLIERANSLASGRSVRTFAPIVMTAGSRNSNSSTGPSSTAGGMVMVSVIVGSFVMVW